MPLPLPSTTPPVAPRRPTVHEAHGDRRPDDYQWLADRDDPDTLSYLEAENAYADAVLAPTTELQRELFDDIRGRVVETDVDAPVRSDGWWYWTRTVEGRQYPIFCRRPDADRTLDTATVLAEARAALAADPEGDDGTVILDANVLAGTSEYFSLGVWDVSPDHTVLAYATDLDGSERYRLRFRDLTTGTDLDDEVDGVTYGSAWSADSRTLLYVRPDAAMRPYQVWRHTVGTAASQDVLVWEDLDERFFVSVGATRSHRYLVIQSGSKLTSECLWLDAADPAGTPQTVLGREAGVEYDVDHAVWPGEGDVWLVRTNRPGPEGPAPDFCLRRMPVGGTAADLVTVVAPETGVKLDDVDPFEGWVVLGERTDGLERLRILRPGGEEAPRVVPQPDAVYSLLGASNPEWTATAYRFGYTSLVVPPSTVEVDLAGLERTTLRSQPVRGYDPDRFTTTRVWATAADGTRIPISVVGRLDVVDAGGAPCLLYGYGSYEINIDPTFSTLRLNLLERGVVFAIAHIRGGGEMGRHWHEQGRLEAKATTFTDFVTCAEHLVATGLVDAQRIVVRGGSAGGLLMGAVTNLRPDLWRAVVAEVPFVDVVTTMFDESLPLTVTEHEEWGDPNQPDAYRTMLAYSPYDNVTAADYPSMYVTGGLNDPRVGYWEPAKWVAKLRATRTDTRPIILRTELGAGHQGLSGRYDVWRDEARVQAFVLASLDLA